MSETDKTHPSNLLPVGLEEVPESQAKDHGPKGHGPKPVQTTLPQETPPAEVPKSDHYIPGAEHLGQSGRRLMHQVRPTPGQQGSRTQPRPEGPRSEGSRPDSPDVELSRVIQQFSRGSLRGLLENSQEPASHFERLLQRLMAPASASAASSAVATSGVFAAKTSESWHLFFQNLSGLSSAEVQLTAEMQALQEALFRGLMRSGGDARATVLISDLKFTVQSGTITDKFSRVLIQHPELLSALERMHPGEVIAPKFLEMFADKLHYTSLAHVPDVMNERDKESAARQSLAQMRAPVSSQSTLRLEQALALFGQKEQKSHMTDGKGPGAALPFLFSQSQKPLAGPLEAGKQRFLGMPKNWIKVLYVFLATLIVLGLAYLLS